MTSHGPSDEKPPDATHWSRVRAFLCRLFLKLGARGHDAEDLAQESLARVVGLTTANGSPVSLGYAAAVGRNLWRDELRTRMRRPKSSPPDDDLRDPAPPPPEVAAGVEDEARLRDAIAGLDPRHRDAIRLVVIERRTYEEAARVLGVPKGTVKSRIHYGVLRLRARLAGSEDPRSGSC